MRGGEGGRDESLSRSTLGSSPTFTPSPTIGSCPTPSWWRLFATEEQARGFAGKHRIARCSTNLDERLSRKDYDVADICLPNHLHAQATIRAASSGKHVILEKPLCLTLEEADEMIAVCKAHDRKLMYAEELCFAPKYERVRQLVSEDAVGSIYYLRQCEKHSDRTATGSTT